MRRISPVANLTGQSTKSPDDSCVFVLCLSSCFWHSKVMETQSPNSRSGCVCGMISPSLKKQMFLMQNCSIWSCSACKSYLKCWGERMWCNGNKPKRVLWAHFTPRGWRVQELFGLGSFVNFQVCPSLKNWRKFNLQKTFPVPCQKILLANPHTSILSCLLTSASK